MTSRRSITAVERRRRLAVRHRLGADRRTDDVVAIADALVALHSTDPVTVYLTAAARMIHPDLQTMDAAMYGDRTLVRHHAMRRTLWVFTPDVARIAHGCSTAALAKKERKRLEQQIEASGATDDGASWLGAACADTLAVLAEHGPMTARRLGSLVPALRTPLVLGAGTNHATTVAAHTRILLLLGFEGHLVRTRPTGSWINGEYSWTPMASWLPGGMTGLDPVEAAGQLARRWLHAFGPAPLSDLQWWAGWSGAVAKGAVAQAGAVEVDLDGQTGWILADDLEPVPELQPWVALLPGLDPTTMGWKQRDWYLPPEHTPVLFDRNGNGGPTIWVDGRVVGGWVQRKNGEIAQRILSPVDREQQAAIDEAAARLQALLGEARFAVRFPAPLQGELLAPR